MAVEQGGNGTVGGLEQGGSGAGRQWDSMGIGAGRQWKQESSRGVKQGSSEVRIMLL